MTPEAAGEDRLRELAALYRLDDPQTTRLQGLLGVLATEADAPSTVRGRAVAVDVHVADSLCALRLAPLRSLAPGAMVADLGSGAGFPGLALAVALPQARVLLVESQERKCAYLRRTVAAIALGNVEVVCARAEEWKQGMGACSVVLARALASQPVVLEYAAPLLEPGGWLLDWRGERRGDEERAAEAAAQELGMELCEVAHTSPFPEAREHHIHVFEKVGPTPERFPRRPGIARKRPLGGRSAA